MGASWHMGWARNAADVTNSVWTLCMRELSPSLFPPCDRLLANLFTEGQATGIYALEGKQQGRAEFCRMVFPKLG